MAVTPPRDRPFVQFNFLVDIGNGTDGVQAGFQEVSGLGMEVTVAEYRAGNKAENTVQKISGMNKSTDVTLKRGIMGAPDIYQWLDMVRNGNVKKGEGLRDVKISLRSEDHTSTVFTWTLQNARPSKCTFGPLNAKGTDVAMEELVLAYERMQME
jgi:phage tail-like protein